MYAKLLFPIVFAISFAPVAQAEQCISLSQDQISTAVALLNYSQRYLNFCQPCGDQTPAEVTVTKVNQMTVDPGTPDLAQFNQTLVVNDSPMKDLAYMYVKIGSDTWANLGLLANCTRFSCDSSTGKCSPSKVTAVSQFLTETNGTFAPGPIY